jgi:low affinity Fe/Cu permease
MDRASLGKPLTRLGVWTASPTAFGVVMVYVLAWIAFDRESLDFHGVATVVTWLMTLFIQRAEHRDTQALQGKLDELLRAHGEAREKITQLDEQEPEEIEAQRARDKPL